MKLVCKHCKVETDRDYCRICGSHDLIDFDNRFVDKTLNISAILYDRIKRAFCLEADGRCYTVQKLQELSNIGIGNLAVMLKSFKKLNILEQREIMDVVFNGHTIAVTVQYDELFDTITKIYNRNALQVDGDRILDIIRQEYGVEELAGGYVVGSGERRILINNLTSKNKRYITMYYVVFVGDGYMVISGRDIARFIDKSDVLFDDTFIKTLHEMFDVMDDVLDRIFDEAEKHTVPDEFVYNYIDNIYGSGRVSGYIVSNIIENVRNEMSYLDIAYLLISGMNFTKGVGVKHYLAKKAGEVILGKF